MILSHSAVQTGRARCRRTRRLHWPKRTNLLRCTFLSYAIQLNFSYQIRFILRSSNIFTHKRNITVTREIRQPRRCVLLGYSSKPIPYPQLGCSAGVVLCHLPCTLLSPVGQVIISLENWPFHSPSTAAAAVVVSVTAAAAVTAAVKAAVWCRCLLRTTHQWLSLSVAGESRASQ